MSWEIATIVFIYGAIIGSFLNVCIYRIPLRENLIFPASHCPNCKSKIRWRDNIPIFGWLLLKGRCHTCQEPISWNYPVVEAITALLSVAVIAKFGLTFTAFSILVLTYAFVVLSVIDFHHYILPDLITLPGMISGLGVMALPWIMAPFPTFTDALIGLLAGGGGLWGFAALFEKITGKQGMGFGDVKLLAMIGAWLGWQALPYTLFTASCVGSVVGVIWMIAAKRDRSQPIPFGPYLIIAAWSYLFIGDQAYAWYFGY